MLTEWELLDRNKDKGGDKGRGEDEDEGGGRVSGLKFVFYPDVVRFSSEPPPPGKPGYSSCEEEKLVLMAYFAVKSMKRMKNPGYET